GEVKELSPAAMATIRALAHNPGAVVSRAELLGALPGNSTDTHAVETAVLRLRTALGDKQMVSTVVKRGYRLSLEDPDEAPTP
ncbi:MAG: winged helix-turn-helix domain-containing protein, partial [Mycobacterium sp.]